MSVANVNNMCSPGDVGFQPYKIKLHTPCQKVHRKVLKEDSVVHRIKRCTDIEEGEEVDLVLLIDGRVDVRQNSEYCCLGGMISAETGWIF